LSKSSLGKSWPRIIPPCCNRVQSTRLRNLRDEKTLGDDVSLRPIPKRVHERLGGHSILFLPSFCRVYNFVRKLLVAHFVRGKAEALMNVHISYRLLKIPAVEKDIQHQIEKLRKRLQVFRPELVHLKGVVEEVSPREGTSVSLNLRLPSGQLAVQTSASTPAAAVKSAFEDLLQQVNKHKEILRASHKWQRGRRGNVSRPVPPMQEVPFEQTLAAVHPPTISADDVRSYVNVNLARLERFIEREIYFRETQEGITPDALSKDEVIDETIAAALGEGQEKPERLALEPWLYRLALKALEDLSHTDETDGRAVPLEDSARQRNVKGTDEPELQFHQPDESITGETVIPDSRVATPEQIIASDEMLRLIASALRDLGSGPREAFILHAIEGFSIGEITAITGLPSDRIITFVSAARDHLRRSPGLAREFQGRIAATGAA
jgi:DNA-directed RNA polymerase specialized sigma24 family protein/ribosome-associated translation inhibitor RaiA